uniref:Uncharacterized protein n=1 Tax=Anguilla anguilla TaxID=7936 RepID=A0A0E9Q5C7_ANGAN
MKSSNPSFSVIFNYIKLANSKAAKCVQFGSCIVFGTDIF